MKYIISASPILAFAVERCSTDQFKICLCVYNLDFVVLIPFRSVLTFIFCSKLRPPIFFYFFFFFLIRVLNIAYSKEVCFMCEYQFHVPVIPYPYLYMVHKEKVLSLKFMFGKNAMAIRINLIA